MRQYAFALIEKPHDEGLTRSEVCDLYDMLDGVEVIPVDIQAEYSAAMGFVSVEAAEALDYDLEKVKVAHEAARQQREFKTSYTAFMIWAINNQIKPNEKTVIRSGFNDFDQRKYDYEELERAALQ